MSIKNDIPFIAVQCHLKKGLYMKTNKVIIEDYDEELYDAINSAAVFCRNKAHELNIELRWIKPILCQPIVEHFSFYVGGQAYFIQVIDMDHKIHIDSTATKKMLEVADAYNGYACFMLLKKFNSNNITSWCPVYPNWGLIEIKSGKEIDPYSLVSDHPVLATRWELHQYAIDFVVNHLISTEHNILAIISNPKIMPSIWFENNDQAEWVVVKEYFYPYTSVDNIDDFVKFLRNSASSEYHGYYAEVGIHALNQDLFKEKCPLYRGDTLNFLFDGLKKCF